MNAFPAVHFKPMDWYDYVLKFSNELLVILLVLLVSGLNLYAFGLARGGSYADSSHAARLLSYHPNLNPKLYATQLTTSRVLVDANGFISQAAAEDYFGALPQEDDGSGEPVVISDDAIVKPNPDSVSGLIAKQVKIYETKAGDTLSAIAKDNGISVQTLAGANKLSATQQLKPGWQLIVLPVDGVLHKASSNDTVPDIARRYGVKEDVVISYNALENAEDIEPGQIFIVPGGKLPTPVQPKPKTPNSGKVNPKGVTPPRQYSSGTGHIFPWGYCTWYVATKVHVPWGGNAKNWLANARAYGAVITNAPSVGAIVVTTDNRRYGHVALVEAVDDQGFTVSEMNYKKFGRVNTRWISKGSGIIRGFILP